MIIGNSLYDSIFPKTGERIYNLFQDNIILSILRQQWFNSEQKTFSMTQQRFED